MMSSPKEPGTGPRRFILIGAGCLLLGLAVAAVAYMRRSVQPPASSPLLGTGAPDAAPRDLDATSRPAQISVSIGFECSNPHIKATQVSPAHFIIRSTETVATGGFYVLLRLEGVAGRTVQLDLTGAPFNKWGNAIPEYSSIATLGGYGDFESVFPAAILGEEDGYRARRRTGDLAALPDTSGQNWHYFSVVKRVDGGIFVQQRFKGNTAYVAFRVPYSPEYNQAFLARLQNSAKATVSEIGRTENGRPLDIVTIPANPARSRPCVLFYAREHADEQDSSWIAEGVVQFLISDDPQARSLRDQVTFLVIPLLDPDGAANGLHENIINSFAAGATTRESRLYAGWFQQWVGAGHRLDVVIPLHNPPPSSAFHVACPRMELEASRFKACKDLHEQIRTVLLAAGYLVRLTPWTTAKLPERLSGWLEDSFGALVLPYEVNSLTPKRQLNLREVRQIGKQMSIGAGSFFMSPQGEQFLQNVDSFRNGHQTSKPSPLE